MSQQKTLMQHQTQQNQRQRASSRKDDHAKTQPVPQMKKVGNYLIDLDKNLGQGQYGKVYLAHEIPDQNGVTRTKSQTSLGDSNGDAITKPKNKLNADGTKSPEFCACKVVERQALQADKEQLVVHEIQNQDSVDSAYVVKLRKAIKTDSRYYMFMDYCNGGDLKDLMELKKYDVDPKVIQTIMRQLVTGFSDMMSVLVIHRDLKLQNIMLNFPENDEELINMNKEERKKFLRTVDLLKIKFEIKIADFGFSKKLKKLEEINKTICGTPLYMAPQVVQKKEYSYKADIWSIGVILFELLNTLTPFHAKNRPEFENKVHESSYNLREACKENLTLECILFLSHCLQHNEQERKSFTDLMKHPYITNEYEDQKKIDSKHLSTIFQGQNDKQASKKRASSAAPRLTGASKKDGLQLIFNAKDKDQLKKIEQAIKDDSKLPQISRPSARTFASSLGGEFRTQLGEEDRFKTTMKTESGAPNMNQINLGNMKNARMTVDNKQGPGSMVEVGNTKLRDQTEAQPKINDLKFDHIIDQRKNQSKTLHVAGNTNGLTDDSKQVQESIKEKNSMSNKVDPEIKNDELQRQNAIQTASIKLTDQEEEKNNQDVIPHPNLQLKLTKNNSNNAIASQLQLENQEHMLGPGQKNQSEVQEVDKRTTLYNNDKTVKREDSRNTYNQKAVRGPSDERDINMQGMRDDTIQVRQSQQKKTIKKTQSPQGGSCFSIFSCCNKPSNVSVEQRIESKQKNSKRVTYNQQPEIHE